MTNEYKQLKPAKMSLFQRTILGIAAAGLVAFGGYKTVGCVMDKIQNRVEVEVSSSKLFLQLGYKEYKEGEPELKFVLTRYKKCCEEVITRKINGVLLQFCKPYDGEYLPRVSGVKLKTNDSTLYDPNCDKKCNAILNNESHRIIYRSEKGYDKQFETADQNLIRARTLINMEIDLEKTVNDWLDK
jgi:hypothetical protein